MRLVRFMSTAAAWRTPQKRTRYAESMSSEGVCVLGVDGWRRRERYGGAGEGVGEAGG